MTKYNFGVGAVLVSRGYTSGQLAMREDIPTLEDVAAVLGRDTVESYVSTLVYKLEEAGCVTLSTDGADANRIRRELAAMVWTLYKYLNVAELLLFTARYMSGEYDEAMRGTHGASRIYVALRAYSIDRAADVRRLERERATKVYLENWAEQNARACTYQEYLNTRDDEQATSTF